MTKFNFNQLLSLSNDDFQSWIGKPIIAHLKADRIVTGRIIELEGAANPPHLIFGFKLDSDKTINFQHIDFIELQ